MLDAALAMRQALGSPGQRMRLIYVGDSPDRAWLQQRCPEAVFIDQRHGADLATHYASADVFLFGSLTETFGNVVTEAMASGLAVVAYDHAAAGQLIRHGQNGLLARCDDLAGFCHLARRLAGDRAQQRALGLQARVTAMGLDWGRIVDLVEEGYADAISPRAMPVGSRLAAARREAQPAEAAAETP